MNLPIVWRLVRKDLDLHRLPILGLSVALPLMGLAVAVFGDQQWGYMGLVLMSNSLIWLCFFLPLGIMIGERKNKTLAFVLSLPVSAFQHALAKLLVGLIAFLLPWTLYLLTLPLLTSASPIVPSGSVPLIVLVLFFFLFVYVVTTIAAILFESLWLSGGIATVLVVLAFAFGPSLGSLPPALLEHWAGPRIVWDAEVVWTITSLALLTLVVAIGGVVLGGRRRDLL